MGCCSREYRSACMPKCCNRRCVGTFTTKYRVYETCCYDVMKVCSNCGGEFDYRQHHCCPSCGMQMDAPLALVDLADADFSHSLFSHFGEKKRKRNFSYQGASLISDASGCRQSIAGSFFIFSHTPH